MILLTLLAGGLVLGLLVGRWWALVAAGGLGVWIAVTEDAEVPGWWLGLVYAGFAVVGIAAGLFIRRLADRSARPS